MMKMGAPLPPEELAAAAAELGPMNEYMMEALERKKQAPGDDLMSTLLAAELDGRNVTDLNVLMLSTAVLVAGNGTTRNLLGGMVFSLATHPDQLAAVVADRALAGGVVEETLRWVTPVPGFLRTATRDTEIRGQEIRAGEHVYMMYMSANWDEEIFEDPARFDIARDVDPSHVSFGFGQHLCVGMSVARLEARVFIEELFDRFSGVELAGEPVRVRSVLENAWSRLPVVFR